MNSDQGALGFVLLGLEILHGWRLNHLSGQPITVLDYPYSKLFFLKSSWNLSFQLIPVASIDWHEVRLCLFNSLLVGTGGVLLGTLQPPLHQVEQTHLLQCLLIGQVLQSQTILMAGGKYNQKLPAANLLQARLGLNSLTLLVMQVCFGIQSCCSTRFPYFFLSRSLIFDMFGVSVSFLSQ